MQDQSTDGAYRMARRPTKDEGRIVYPLIRCGIKPLGNAVILSHDITGCYTHYWCRRTIPCRSDGCPACEKGYSARWHGWVFIMDSNNRSKAIFEFTAGASAALTKYFNAHRTLRGAELRAYRNPPKANGRLLIEVCESKFEADALPKGIKVLPILMRMWHARFEPATAEVEEAADDTAAQIRLHLAEKKRVG